ncbi:hypothetical protein DOU03_08155 [Clavibacter michiganensis subsp. michiganensis]|nr:hypothetical protein [Clavibacter michiganensis subsp. michiganensis]
MRHGCHRSRGARQDLPPARGTDRARARGPRPRGAGGHGARVARPERRGEDHGREGAHHAHPPGCRPGGGRRRGRPHAWRRGPGDDRRLRPVRGGRREPHRVREPRHGRPAVPPGPPRVPGAGRRAHRRLRAHRGARPSGEGVLGRHAAAHRPRGRPRRPPPRALPRRAHDRAGSPQPPGPLGRHHAARHRGHDRAPHHPVPRGGRPARGRHRGDRRRDGHRARHGRRAEELHRRSPGGGRARGRRRRAGGARHPRARGDDRTRRLLRRPDAVRAGGRRSASARRGRRAPDRGGHRAARRGDAAPDARRRLPPAHRARDRDGRRRRRRRSRSGHRRGGGTGCRRPSRRRRSAGDGGAVTAVERRARAGAAGPEEPATAAAWLNDGWIATRRNLIKIKRLPDILVFTLIQPIMFVLLFSFVYAGAIDIPGSDYKEFIMAGIFAQTVVFGSTYSGSAMANDLKDGIIDRFRTLPMSPSAVLVGRTNGDLLINVFSMVVMLATGFVVGWRVRSSLLEALAGVALLLLFAYALSWVMAFLGMSVRSPEVINNASFLVLFPLTFISNAFVPSDSLPTPLRVFAEYNPVSSVVLAARQLFGNVPAGTPVPDAWTLQNPVATTLIWAGVLLVVAVPLAVRKYRTISTR